MPVLGAAAAALAVKALIAAVVSVALSTVIGLVSRAFIKKPQKSPLAFDDRTISVRQPIQPWEIVYGELRKGGVYGFIDREGTTVNVWLILIWAAHECAALGDLFIDDEQVEITLLNEVTGTYAGGKLLIWDHLGADDQLADEDLKAAFPLKWTDDHRLRGRCYSVFKLVNFATNWSSIVPNFSRQVRGNNRIEDPRTGIIGYSDNAVLCWRDHLLSTTYGLGAPRRRVDDALNIAEEADRCDEFIDVDPVADYAYVSNYYQMTSIDLANNRVTLGTHALVTGQPIRVTSSVTLPAPLAELTTYYAVRDTSTQIKFATSEANAQSGIVIDLTSGGTGNHFAWSIDERIILAGLEAVVTSVNTTTNELNGIYEIINVDPAVSVRLIMKAPTMPAPLVQGTRYYAYGPGSNLELQLATSPTSTAIDLTSGGSGERRMRIDGMEPVFIDVDAATDVFTYADTFDMNALPTGTPVKIGGSPRPTPLANVTYYWINDGQGSGGSPIGRLARSRRRAARGEHIDITDEGLLVRMITDYHPAKAITGLVTGDRVILDGEAFTGSGKEFYWIRLSPTSGKLASSLDNARLGIGIEFNSQPLMTSADRNTLTRVASRRYTCNGVFNTDQDPEEVQRAILSAAGAVALQPVLSGKWRIKTARWRPPRRRLDETMVREGGKIVASSRLPSREAANTIRGVYVTPENFDQAASFPEVSDEDFVEEDGGRKIVKDIGALPFTNSRELAVRLATIELMRGRQQRTLQFPTTLRWAAGLEPTDTVRVSLPALGYDDVTFEVQSMELTLRAEEGRPPVPEVDLVLKETGPEVYWP